MSPTNHLIATFEEGAVLSLHLDNCPVHAYVVVSEPNIDLVADIVPKERFEAEGDIHVMAVAQPEDAAALIEDVTQNINPDDTIVFLCVDKATKDEVLAQFGIIPGQAQQH